MRFQFQQLEIPDIVLIEPTVLEDDRGFFSETYKYSEFSDFGIRDVFMQDAHSQSRRGVLRGLHYQKKHRAQGKLIRVVVGALFDVAVDLRTKSPTYGKWVGVQLSAANRKMLYIPPGFAHGFCALTELAEVLYKTTDEHAPESERGILWNDPELGITWPLTNPIVSSRDAAFPRLREADNDF